MSQPPCESVSWNIIQQICTCWCIVSASLWGCELKFLMLPVLHYSLNRQPPCEAVSWNMTQGQISEDNTVSLLVRLWVEIPCFTKPNNDGLCQPPCEAVSWNKSESSYKISLPCQPPCEAVSWNATRSVIPFSSPCQPPCEAVSWNGAAAGDCGRCSGSASLWGC